MPARLGMREPVLQGRQPTADRRRRLGLLGLVALLVLSSCASSSGANGKASPSTRKSARAPIPADLHGLDQKLSAQGYKRVFSLRGATVLAPALRAATDQISIGYRKTGGGMTVVEATFASTVARDAARDAALAAVAADGYASPVIEDGHFYMRIPLRLPAAQKDFVGWETSTGNLVIVFRTEDAMRPTSSAQALLSSLSAA